MSKLPTCLMTLGNTSMASLPERFQKLPTSRYSLWERLPLLSTTTFFPKGRKREKVTSLREKPPFFYQNCSDDS